ncbi:MAG TPA: hypothetical protein VNY05_45180 [Candidatus Acidoferrales bacterium]|nr:hypothetical protein [Candidatus Acidoferrales bacterium]
MKWRGALFALAAIAPRFASAQDIAPEVLLLSRIRDHVREELAHLPNYTCMETMQRFRKAAGPKETLKAFDTVHLEVLYADGKELYASPGDRRFLDDNPVNFIGSGMIGTGTFASWLRTLFVDNQATFAWRGPERVAGHRSVRWDFRVPVRWSGYTLTVAGVSGAAGIKGSVWADPESLDPLQLSVDADDIPFGMPVMEVNTTLIYARERVGNAVAMLPQTAVMRLLSIAFEEERNYLEFTHCHEFRAESSLTFGPPEDAAAASGPRFAVSSAPQQALPKGLDVTLALATPITEKDLVGSLISARVLGPVRSRGKVLIPEGATVRGRIRRLEHYDGQGGYFVVGLEFTDIESDGARVRFYADLQDIDRSPGIEWMLRKSTTRRRTGASLKGEVTTSEQIFVTNLPGVGTFFVRGDRLNLPAGLKMVWKTVSASSPQSANR